MTARVDLSVNYHQQDTLFACGAACAQMSLVSQVNNGPYLGRDLTGPPAGPPNENYQQTVASNDNVGLLHEIQVAMGSQTFGGGAHPKAFKEVLCKRKEASDYGNISFRVYASTNLDTIICRIVHTIEVHRIAPAVLVNRGRHWVTVSGCNYGVVSGRSRQIEIVDFVINDPLPAIPGWYSDAKYHSPGDDCGRGVIPIPGSLSTVDRGTPAIHVRCRAWLSVQMASPLPDRLSTGEDTGDLGGCYVAVCAVRSRGSNAAKYTSFQCV